MNNLEKLKYVLTGGPSVGKTSILTALELKGYSVVREAATDVINYEQARDNPRPWEHMQQFQEKIAELHLGRLYQCTRLNNRLSYGLVHPNNSLEDKLYLKLIEKSKYNHNLFEEAIFTDRDPLDNVVYLKRSKTEPGNLVSKHLKEARVKRDISLVFLVEDIGNFEKNGIRREDAQEAAELTHDLEEFYKSEGYRVIHIPAGSVEKRAIQIVEYAAKHHFG